MASNAKEPDGKCIPKSMRKSVESACGKKKAVKASDSECKYRIDIFKKDNPDALVKREFKMFKSEDEAKKYGDSIANGNIVNVMKVNAGCTKKSVKSSKGLTVPKSKRETVKASYDVEWDSDSSIMQAVQDYIIDNYGIGAALDVQHVNYVNGDDFAVDCFMDGKQVESEFFFYLEENDKSIADLVRSQNMNGIDGNDFEIQFYKYQNQISAPQIDIDKYSGNFGQKAYNRLTDLVKRFESACINTYQEINENIGDFLAQFDTDSIQSSKSVKKFGVKASALAKRKAQQRITAAESNGLERAKQYIVDAYNNENWDSEDMTVDEYFENEDLHKVGLVYTTLGDNDEYDYQISVDLIDPKVFVEIDGKLVYEDSYSNIDALADDLADFNWDDWYSYYIHKLPKEYDEVIFSSCANSAKSIKCAQGSYSDFDEDMPFYVAQYYDTKFRDTAESASFDDMDEAVDYAHECLGKGPTSIEHYSVGRVDIDPDEYWENFDGEFWCTPELAEWRDEVWKSMGIGASKNVNAGITVGEDDRYDFSNPIYELDDYVKSLADGTVNQVQGITYDISKETIAFFDEDNNVVFVQPIGGIIPEPDDLETDINELSAAIRSEMDNAYGRDNWGQDNDDPDYASRAVELSEDIGEVDIDDLEPITGDDVDYGYGYDSNGDAIDESTVDELYRIAEYEILPKSELAKIDEYVSIDEDSWDFYMSSPHVTEKFYIHFKLTEKDINFNDYTLPDGKMFPDFNYYTAVLDFDIYAENGEITSVILEDKKIYRPDGAFDDYDVKQFDDLYNVEALINYVEHLAADTVKDIYNGTTNL